MSDDLKRVAERLRLWREDADLSLQGLATQCGVAASTIQKVERQQMVPTIAVLLKIAQGLGRRPSEFLDEQSSHCEAAHNAETRRRKHTDGNGATIERLSADLVDQRFDVYRVEHAPGSSMGQVPIHFDGEQLILGLSGELTVSIDGQHHPVGPGDTLHWKVDLPVSWRNDGGEPARFLVVGTLPQDMRGVLRGRGPAARALDPAPALTRRRDA